ATRQLRDQLAAQKDTFSDEQRALLARFDAGLATYLESWPKVKDAYGGPAGGQVAAADAVIAGKDREAADALDRLAETLSADADEKSAALLAAAALALQAVAVVLVAAVLIALALVVGLSSGIASRVAQ